jgi:DNA-binding transcriptional LysR family regulator
VRDLVTRFVSMGGGTVCGPLEADGWPLMLHLVGANLGVAIVNGCCTPPPGVVLRPVPELGSVVYRLLWRRGQRLSAPAQALNSFILEASPPAPAPTGAQPQARQNLSLLPVTIARQVNFHPQGV